MNKDARTELLRWAAEEVLGWATIPPETENERRLGPYYCQGVLTDLTGWLGFGLAVGAAKRRGFDMVYLRTVFAHQLKWETEITTSDFIDHYQGCDEDPAISAWLALKELEESNAETTN